MSSGRTSQARISSPTEAAGIFRMTCLLRSPLTTNRKASRSRGVRVAYPARSAVMSTRLRRIHFKRQREVRSTPSTAVRRVTRYSNGRWPSPCPSRLPCREKWLEYLVRERDNRTPVADFGLDHVHHLANAHASNSVRRSGFHRLDAIADQIDQHLLHLDVIKRDERKTAFNINIDTNAAPRRLLGHKVACLGNDVLDRRAARRFFGLLEQGADAADDVCRIR